ncbi:MAG: ATP-binding protein [Alphaproteobacteria bacterium]
MIIKNLTLKNFRKFKNATVEFPDGVTGVVGLNGAGKSTIFEAIAWVLYGPAAARTSADQIKTKNLPSTDPCRVELEFVFEGENYRVVREMKGKSLTTQATATINGKVAATSAESVTRFIQKKLGMDFKSFFTSIFARQKELNALSSMNASERRPLILRMLGIDSLDDVIKEVRSDKKQKENFIERLSEDLLDKNKKNKDQVYKEKIREYERDNQKINKELQILKKKTEKEKTELEKLKKTVEQHKKEHEKLNKEQEKQSEQKIIFENKLKLEKEIKEIKDKILQRKKNLDAESKKLGKFKTIETDLKFVEKKILDVNKKIENLVKEIEKRKTLSDRIQKDIFDLEKKKEKIEKIGPEASCPTCERTLSDQYNVLIKRFEKDIKTKLAEKEKYLKETTEQDGKKEINIREKTALEKRFEYLQKELREKERVNSAIHHINSELKGETQFLDKKESFLKKIGRVTFDGKVYDKIKKQVKEFFEKYESSQRTLSDKKDILSELKLELERKQNNIKLNDQEIKNLKEKIEQLEKFKKQIKEEKNQVKYLSILSDVMSDFRTFLISRIRPTLSSYASDFFNRLTNGKYPEVELDEKYDLQIYDDGELYNINRFSGGEEDLANLCLRLAISEVITERAGGIFNFIILDEIFGSQDYLRRQNIMKALNGLSSKFRQIFLITHIEDVKNDMENIIYVTENEDGCSSIKLE